MNKIESAYKEMMEDVQMSGLMIAYCMKDKALELERELTAVTYQRDRLAKAVNAATILIAAKGRHNTMLAYNGLRDALQSLTTNTPDQERKSPASDGSI